MGDVIGGNGDVIAITPLPRYVTPDSPIMPRLSPDILCTVISLSVDIPHRCSGILSPDCLRFMPQQQCNLERAGIRGREVLDLTSPESLRLIPLLFMSASFILGHVYLNDFLQPGG